MIPEFGHFALILALCLVSVQASIPLLGAHYHKNTWMALARPLAVGQFIFISFAFLCLSYAFVTDDFSVAYVAQNSNTHLPLFYKLTALWGAHEGSMLLWVSVLAFWTVLVAIFSKSLPLDMVARVLAVLAWINIGFLIFILTLSDPFSRLLPNYPSNGQGLNPLLQDPGLAMHPPTLYMGYVGFSVVFAFAIAALLSGKLDSQWARWSRPWTIAAWCFLTIGITLGSWWSYRVLGWGGWWFWDPVENASFLPWLTGTALIHSLIVAEKRDAFKGWTVLLAICAFSLSLLGTFLVRSGILVSVHAFAVDPSRGSYMLRFLFVVVGFSLLLYAARAHKIKGQGNFALLSKETLLLSNNVLLMVAMATVLLGTIYPLILQILGWGKISVGAPYFNAVFVPLMAPLLFVMGLGPQSNWQRMPWPQLLKQLWFVFSVSLILAIALPYIFTGQNSSLLILGLGLALWVLITTVYAFLYKSRHYGMLFAHVGLAITVIGITLTSSYSIEKDVRMAPGDSVNISNYQFRFIATQPIQGPNYTGVQADVEIYKNNQELIQLNPQKRIFPVAAEAISEPGISPGIFKDFYVALGENIEKNAWAVRIYYKPFVRWIWAGGFLMLLGGLLALYKVKTSRTYS